MALALNALAVGLGVAMSFPLIKDFFPDDEASVTKVRIGVGKAQDDGKKTASTGGYIPHVALFDSGGERIGVTESSGHKISDGGFADVKVYPLKEGQNTMPAYLSVSASGSDAVCIQYIAVTAPNSDYRTWNGDFAVACNATYYPSKDPLPNTDYLSKCVWLSDDGRFPQGFSIHLRDFDDPDQPKGQARAQQYIQNRDTLCKSKPRQSIYPKLTQYHCVPHFVRVPERAADGTDSDTSQVILDGEVACKPAPGVVIGPEDTYDLQYHGLDNIPRDVRLRRSLRKQRSNSIRAASSSTSVPREPCTDELVISNNKQHSAKEVCEDEKTWGPDFASMVEGLYCDMCERRLWNLCSEKVTHSCFDIEAKQIRPGIRPRDEDDASDQPSTKSFKQVSHWGSPIRDWGDRWEWSAGCCGIKVARDGGMGCLSRLHTSA